VKACVGVSFTFRDGVFRLLYGVGEHAVARMCLDKRYVIFMLGELKYLMNMLHIVQDLMSTFTASRGDVSSYAASAAGFT
jgi:hypothetical protein